MANDIDKALNAAVIATEREIAGAAWGEEETDLDESGDRSLESMGEGLEGQHEPDDEDEPDGDEPEGEEESEGEEEPVVAADAAKPEPGKDGQGEQPIKPEPKLIPSGKLREATEARRAVEAERDALKAELAKNTSKALEDRLELALREIENLKRAPARSEPPKPADKPKRPDLFEDPDGAIAFVEQGVQQQIAPLLSEIRNLRVENSMAIAHAFHKDTFERAFVAINKLDPKNPDDFTAVKRIYDSPNPGEALVTWHKDREARAEVGNDLPAYKERLRAETREALMKDPEFRKALIAELRGDAVRGDDGQPRTQVRLPRSLNGAAGSNIGAERSDPHQFDGSDEAVAAAAWR